MPSGIAVVDKPAGWTSHQVVGRIRRLAGTRKVGHAGTLDPMATGVLVVGVERATRLLGQLTLTDKDYLATIRLGISTVTDDAEGETVTATGAVGLTVADVEAQLVPLRGEIWQTPASVSAIKVKGVRSYARVRAGEDVALVPRQVTVSQLDLLELRTREAAQFPVIDVDVRVSCSSGTYVRALARDLGAALGVGGHLTSLRRTRVGPFHSAQAQALDEAQTGLHLLSMSEVARLCFATAVVDDEQAVHVRHGRRLETVQLPSSTTALLTADGEFLALYRPDGGGAAPISVFAEPAGAASSAYRGRA